MCQCISKPQSLGLAVVLGRDVLKIGLNFGIAISYHKKTKH